MNDTLKTETQAAMTKTAQNPENTPFFTTITIPFPFSYEGKTYETLTFDWQKLTGKDFAQVEREMKMTNRLLAIEAYDGDFLMLLAVRACREGISEQALQALPLYYYRLIRAASRDFLLMQESEAVEAYGSLNNA